MILVLHGAIKNVGDFLIKDRGLALLQHLVPDESFMLHQRWQPLDHSMAQEARAIVLCGGPGLAADFYPGKFRLVENMAGLETPILPLALGWAGKGSMESFRFTYESRNALETIHQRIGWSSVRDDLSLEVMARAAVGEVWRTGCNVWYHLPSLGTPLHRPDRIRRLVFTTPADMRNTPEVLRVLRYLARRYRSADRRCVFHRGIRSDEYTSKKTAAANRVIAFTAAHLGFDIVDASFDPATIDFYAESDLHVGYRVHAHLDFLSLRRPSILISEDGRGRGQSATLHDPYDLRARQSGLIDRLDMALATEESGFLASTRAVDEIERSWPRMRQTIHQLVALKR